MDPIVAVLRFGDVARPIGSYGVMLVVAIAVGSLLAVRAASRARLDVGATISALGFMAGIGLFVSWALFVAVEWARTGSPVAAIENPGLVFFGAPAGGAIGFIYAARKFGVPVGRFADVALPALPAAHAMGRIGCFLGACCYGHPWDGPFAVTYTHPLSAASTPPVPRHPAPLYESIGLLLLALIFASLPLRDAGSGRRIFHYLAAYGVLRIVVESFRGDAVRGVFLDGAVSTSQILALFVVAGSIAALWWSRGRRVVGGRTAV